MAESRRRYDTRRPRAREGPRALAPRSPSTTPGFTPTNARRDVTAERAAVRLERLQSITAALSHARTPTQVGEVIVGLGLDALGASNALVYVTGESGTSLGPRVSAPVSHAEAHRLDCAAIPIHASHPGRRRAARAPADRLASANERRVAIRSSIA